MIRTVPGGNVGPAGGGGCPEVAGGVRDGGRRCSDRPRKSAAPTTATRTSSETPTTQPACGCPSPDGAGGGTGERRRAGPAGRAPARSARRRPARPASRRRTSRRRSTSAPGRARRRGRGTTRRRGRLPWSGHAPSLGRRTPRYRPPRRGYVPAPCPSPPRQAVVRRLRAAGCVFAEDEARLLMAAAASAGRARRPRAPGGWPASRSSTCSAGPSSAGCGSPSTPGVFVPRRRTEVLVRGGGRPGPARAPSSSTSAAGRGRWASPWPPPWRRRAARRRRRSRPPSPAPAAQRRAGRRPGLRRRPVRRPARRRCAGGSTCCSPTCPTCPATAIALMPPEARRARAAGRRSTAARTVWTSPGG